ncbi:nickel ABC transporter, substrate-binding protein [Escherichia coli]|nr:nickel ABC transporter, substrate-binding protein [Escherichia coli]
MLSTLRRTLFALLACASFIVHAAAPDEITTAWPVNVGPLNPHLYTPNQMFAQSMVYEPLVKYQAGRFGDPVAGKKLDSFRRW